MKCKTCGSLLTIEEYNFEEPYLEATMLCDICQIEYIYVTECVNWELESYEEMY